MRPIRVGSVQREHRRWGEGAARRRSRGLGFPWGGVGEAVPEGGGGPGKTNRRAREFPRLRLAARGHRGNAVAAFVAVFMKNRLTFVVVLGALAWFLAMGARTFRVLAADGDADDSYKQIERFTRVLFKVRNDYVDGDKTNYKELIDGAMRGLMSTLDPHSEYLEPVKFDSLREDTEGQYSGVGLQVQPRDGALQIIAPMEDAPAFEAGLLTGDRIVKIDGKSTEKMSQHDAVLALRGAAGTQVTVQISRPSFAEPKDFVLTRAEIRLYAVKDINNRREFPLGPDKIGYVRLTQFAERTSEELEEALKVLESQGMEGLVMDLRGNPGGLVDQAVAVAEKFVEAGQLIMTTEGRNPASDSRRVASGKTRVRKGNLVILVNGGSASAAEIVSGCLQDLKRAVVVGEQTFGKGSVQSVLPLPDGAALRLTTAKYYTPSHKVIHEKGITPDIVVPMVDDEETAVQLRRLPGGDKSLEDVLARFDEARRGVLRELVKDKRDSQLERAMDLLKGVNLFSKRRSEPKDPRLAPAN